MNDEERAESVVRALHGKVPSWASGAVVGKPDEPALGLERNWIKDATFDDVGHTGTLSCELTSEGEPLFTAVRKPSRQSLRKYGHVPAYPRMLEVSVNITGELARLLHRPRIEGGTKHELGALIGGKFLLLAMILGNGGPKRVSAHHQMELWSTSLEPGEKRIAAGAELEGAHATIALLRRYEWHVAMRIDGAPALTFACTPASARSAYRLRDLPTGKSRRDALIHWVSEHYRNPDIHVSEHLRGKHVFSWRGIECEIVPSAYDREKEIARKAVMAEKRNAHQQLPR